MHRSDIPSSVSRRTILAGLGAAGLASARPAAARTGAKVESLGALAAKRGIAFGAAIDARVLEDAQLAELYRRQTRIVTTDNALKFWSIRPDEKTVSYDEGDRLVDFAKQSAIPIRGHTLSWNDWTPPWIARLSKRERARLLQRHIEETVGRYAGRMHSWDVVNEAIWPDSGNPGGLRGGPWYDAMGKEYVRTSFAAAHRADRSVRLVLNEAGPEWKVAFGPTQAARRGLLNLVDDLQHAGVRLDAVGLECHWFPDFQFAPDEFLALLAELATRKLDIYLTEIDVNDARLAGTVEQRDAIVAARYAELIRTALKEPAVKVVMTWQLSDRESWLNGLTDPRYSAKRDPRPLPFDRDREPKAAYHAIADAFRI